MALAAPDRQFSYSITRGDASRFAVGAADGELRYIGSGENAEQTSEYLLTVTATPHDSGAALHLAVRVAIVDADDRGVVVLSTMQPYLGEEVTASLTGGEGGVRDGSTTWQWWRRKAPRGDWAGSSRVRRRPSTHRSSPTSATTCRRGSPTATKTGTRPPRAPRPSP